MLTAPLIFDGSSKVISYAQIVDAIDLFNEEVNTEKVMFVAPAQVTVLRKDNDFISADKYTGNVIMTGEIGKIANTRIVHQRKFLYIQNGISLIVQEQQQQIQILPKFRKHFLMLR